MTLAAWAVKQKEENAEWMNAALGGLRTFCELEENVSMEVFRATWDREPANPNLWGALTKEALSIGLISDVGRSMKALKPSSNGRRIVIWKSEVFKG